MIRFPVKHFCSICNEQIVNEEEYITNEEMDFAHWSCITGVYELLKFFKCNIETMEEES